MPIYDFHVSKKQGNKTYLYAVESARVAGKPRIVSQTYLGSTEEVLAKLTGAEASGATMRSAHRGFGDVAAVWGMLKSLGIAGIIDEVVSVSGMDPVKGLSVGRFLPLPR